MRTIIARAKRQVVKTVPTVPVGTSATPAPSLGLAAALAVSGWMLLFDRRVAHPIVCVTFATMFVLVALSRPLARAE